MSENSRKVEDVAALVGDEGDRILEIVREEAQPGEKTRLGFALLVYEPMPDGTLSVHYNGNMPMGLGQILANAVAGVLRPGMQFISDTAPEPLPAPTHEGSPRRQ